MSASSPTPTRHADDIAAVLRERGLEVFAEAGRTRSAKKHLPGPSSHPDSSSSSTTDPTSSVWRTIPSAPPERSTRLAGRPRRRPRHPPPARLPDDPRHRLERRALEDPLRQRLRDRQSCLLTVLDLLDPEGLGVPLPSSGPSPSATGIVGMGCACFWRALGAPSPSSNSTRSANCAPDWTDSTPRRSSTPATADHAMSATGELGTPPLAALEALLDGALRVRRGRSRGGRPRRGDPRGLGLQQ